MSSHGSTAARLLLAAMLALPNEQVVLAAKEREPAESTRLWAPCALLGKKAILVMKNGKKIKGHVLECRSSFWIEYAMAYATWRPGNNDLHLPALGEPIAMHRGSPDSRDLVSGTLIGFDFDRVLIRERGQKSVTAVPVEAGLISNDASLIDRKTLHRALRTGRVPVATTSFVLKAKGNRTEVAVKDISKVKRSHTAAKVAWSVAIAVLLVGVAYLFQGVGCCGD